MGTYERLGRIVYSGAERRRLGRCEDWIDPDRAYIDFGGRDGRKSRPYHVGYRLGIEWLNYGDTVHVPTSAGRSEGDAWCTVDRRQ
jgi:hypothetical protein